MDISYQKKLRKIVEYENKKLARALGVNPIEYLGSVLENAPETTEDLATLALRHGASTSEYVIATLLVSKIQFDLYNYV